MTRALVKKIELSPTSVHRNARTLVLVSSLVSIALMMLAFWPSAVFPLSVVSIAGPTAATLSLTVMTAVALVLMRTHRELSDNALLEKVKSANRALAESEQRFRNLFETSPDAIICRRRGPDGTMELAEANDAFLKIYGYTREDFGPDLAGGQLLTEETRTRVRSDYHPRLERDGFVDDMEIAGSRRDGSKFELRGQMWAIKDETGLITETWTTLRDVSEKAVAEKKLKESEQRYRGLFETCPDAIVYRRRSPEGNMVIADANEAYLKLGECAESAQFNSAFKDIAYTDETAKRWQEEYLPRIRQDGFADEMLLNVAGPNGKPIPVKGRFWTLNDEAGEITESWATLRDMSEQDKAEQAVRESEKRFRRLFESSHDGLIVWRASEDGTFKTDIFNSAFAKMFGFEAHTDPEILSRNEHVTPESHAKWMTQYRDPLLSQGYLENYELDGLRADGSTFPIQGSAWTVKDDDGQTIAIWGSFRDVTDKAALEQELELKNRALDQASVGVAIFDYRKPEKPVTYVNRAYVEMTGYTKEDFATQWPVQFGAETEKEKTELQKLRDGMASGGAVQARLRSINKDGSTHLRDVSASPVRSDDGEITHWISVSRDVSQEAKDEERLRILEKAIESAPSGIAVMKGSSTANSTIEYFNPAFENMIGHNRKELIGMPGQTFVKKCYAQESQSVRYDAALDVTPGKEHLVKNIRNDGSEVYRSVQFAPVYDDTGNMTHFIAISRDVTEERKAEEDLRLFKRAMEQNPTAITIVDVTSDDEPKVSFVNEAVAHLHGLTQDDVRNGKTPFRAVRNLIDDELSRELQKARERGAPIDTTGAYTMPDGSTGRLNVRYAPVRDAKGIVTHWMSFATDITPQWRAEQEAHVLKRAFDQAPLGITILTVNKDGSRTVTYRNRGIGEITGDTRTGVIGQPSDAMRDTVKLNEGAAKQMRAARESGQAAELDITVRRADDDVRDCELIYAPVTDPARNGVITHWIAIAKDVTQQRADAQRRQKDAIIIEQIGEAVLQCNLAGEIEDLNPQAEALLARDREHILGRRLSSFCKEADRARRDAGRSAHDISESGKGSWEAPLTRGDGKEIIIETTGAPFVSESGERKGYIAVVRDITARRQAEREAMLMKRAIDQSPLGVSIAELQENGSQQIIYRNPGVEELTGIDSSDIVRKSTHDRMQFNLVSEESMAKIIDARKAGEAAELDVALVRQDGRTVECDMIYAPVRGDGGKVTHWISVLRDVTQQRKDQQRLLENAIVIDQLSEAVLRMNDDGVIVECNAQAETVLGRPRDQIIGQKPSRFRIDRELAARTAIENRKKLRAGDKTVRDAVIVRGDGREAVVEFVAAAVFNPEGRPNGFAAVVRDVTAQREAEHLIRRNAQILEQLSDAVFLTTQDGINIDCNRSMQELLGISRDEFVGRKLSDFGVDPHAQNTRVRSLVKGYEADGELTAELRLKRSDGREVLFACESTLWKSEDGEILGWIGVGRDVTEKRAAEQRMRDLERVIDQSNSLVAIYETRKDGSPVLTYANSALCALTGEPMENLMGKGQEILTINRTISDDVAESLKRAYEAGVDIHYRALCHMPNGEQVPFEYYSAPVKNADGQITNWIILARNVTKQAKAEEHRRVLERALEQSPTAISIATYDDGGDPILTYFNPAFERMTGYEADDVLGMRVEDFPRPTEELKHGWEAYKTGISDGYITQSLRKDGTAYIREIRTASVQDDGGKITHIVTLSNDITERVESEERMRVLQKAVDQSPTAITIAERLLGNEIVFTYANEAYERMTGYRQDDFVGNPFCPLSASRNTEVGDAESEAPTEALIVEQRHRADGTIYVRETRTTDVADPRGDKTHLVSFSNDISDRIRTEDRLRMLERAIEQSPIAVSIAELKPGSEPIFEYVNSAFLDMTGYAYSDVIGKPTAVMRRPNARPTPWIEAYKSAQNFSYVDESTKKDGTTYMREATASPVLGKDGKPTHMISISSDITDRVSSEQRMRTLERAIEQSPTAVAVINNEGSNSKFLYVNPAFERMTGYKKRELAGQSFGVIESRNHGGLDSIGTLNTAAKDLAPASTLIETRHKDGHWFVREMTMAPITNESGENMGWVSISADVTERLANEEKLMRDALILQTLGEAVTFTDPDGVILECNAGACRLFGRPESELIGKPVTDMMADKGTYLLDQPNLLQRAKQGKTIDAEAKIRRKNGAEVLVDYVSAPFISQEGELLGLVTVSRDITEKRALEAQLQHAQKMEAVGQLTGGIAHDFNNLMGVISGSLQLIESENEDWAFVHDMAATANKSTLRGKDLVDRLLAFSRRQTLQPVETDVSALLAETADLLRRSMGETVTLKLDLAPNIPPCLVDQSQLESAIVNLAINARDAMEPGGQLTIAAQDVILEEAPDLPMVCISVEDNGSGMDDETLDKIFEPFFTTKGVGEGSGLGLSMVYGFVKQSGGQIEVDSKPGEGTCFRLYFPATEASVVKAGDAKHDRDGNLVASELTVLVVEDNQEMLKISSHSLSRMGYRVVQAEDATTAMTRIVDHPDIRIAFIDIMLPDGMTGTELAKMLISVRPDLRVLFTSGYSDQNILKDALDISAVVRKPFDLRELEDKLSLLTADLKGPDS